MTTHGTAGFAVGGVLVAGLVAWMLATGKSWWWGRQVTRSDHPRKYWQSVAGAALVAVFSTVTAITHSLGR